MKKVKQIFAMVLAVMMLVSIVPMDTQAAGKFKMNKSSTTIYVGKSTTLSVVRTNTVRTSDNSTIKVTETKKKVKWYSSNKNIAKVSSKGKVTGRKAGKVVITAKVSGKKYTCKVKKSARNHEVPHCALCHSNTLLLESQSFCSVKRYRKYK